ncbi:MAG TPA: efflux RND transporter periplasmic adaptor subunit [Vicinamibacterales bacterium]|jgi:HlyD family secretion protein|nr:efflux RND transporter periplasmic adaptor subunit [Vicinamibacterales bacterium]
MDIARPSNVRKKRIKRALIVTGLLLVVVLVTVALSKLKPAAPTVDAATLWPDTVKRGPMVRRVQGLGTLVPEDTRWISSTTTGRVEKILLHPGTPVNVDSVILELSNPQLEQEVEDAQLRLQSAEAQLANMRIQVDNDVLAQRAALAGVEAEYNKAEMEHQMYEQLSKDQLVSALQLKQSQINAQQLGVRVQIAKDQLASRADSSRAQLAVQQSAVDQARALLQLKQRQRDELKVRAGVSGVLQAIPVEIEIGKQVGPGTDLARVADPSRLMAQIKIAETQAKDIQIGQRSEIDTRNGIVNGKVIRIDPSVQNGTRTVDVSLEGELPRGAVPDLSVDGTIELERLNDVLYMGRPAFGQDQATIGLFKVEPDNSATRVTVKLGRTSVNAVEVLSGLNVGDKVILSDMSAWDAYDRLKLR